MSFPSPAKKRRISVSHQRFVFATSAKIRFKVCDFLSETVSSYIKLAAKMRNTSPEMLMAAILPTTAACMGPNGTLKMKPYGDYSIAGNLYMIGVAEPGSGKSTAYDFGMGQPLEKIAGHTGKAINVADCSKAALLKIQKEHQGRGIICADEVSQFMAGMLKRSHTDTSGVAEPGGGKSTAYDFGMGQPLEKIAGHTGKAINVADCSKAALLKIQKEHQGRGIICADEVSQFMAGMLKRSHTDTSGERQLLLTLWGGRGHSVAYASKSDIELDRSGLCLAGFTQPDRMVDIIEDMSTSSDGLLDRFLFWMLPGYVYSGMKIKQANDLFEKKYLLKNLNPVFLEIFEGHSEKMVEYRFSPAAQIFVNLIEERVKMGILESNSAMIDDSSDEEEENEDIEPIRSICGSKYMDHVGRLSLSLHLFQNVLEQMLGSMAGQIKIPAEIELSTVQSAQKLLEHILKQNEMLLNAMYPNTIYDNECTAEAVEIKKSDLQTDIAIKVLQEPGSLYPTRELTRTRLKGEVVTSSVVNETITEMERRGLGELKKVKLGKTKPQNIFYKHLPSQVSGEVLKFYGVMLGYYSQQFYLPLSSSLKVDVELARQHPQYQLIEEQKKRSTTRSTASGSSKAFNLNLKPVCDFKTFVCTKYSYPSCQ